MGVGVRTEEDGDARVDELRIAEDEGMGTTTAALEEARSEEVMCVEDAAGVELMCVEDASDAELATTSEDGTAAILLDTAGEATDAVELASVEDEEASTALLLGTIDDAAAAAAAAALLEYPSTFSGPHLPDAAWHPAPQCAAEFPHHPLAEQQFPNVDPTHCAPVVPPHIASVDTFNTTVELAVGALTVPLTTEPEAVDTHALGAAKLDVLAVRLPAAGVRYQSFLSVTPKHSASVTIL